MRAYKTRTATRLSGTPVTMIETPGGEELTEVWVNDGDVYWDDPGAGTVRVGTPLEFHEWMLLHPARAEEAVRDRHINEVTQYHHED